MRRRRPHIDEALHRLTARVLSTPGVVGTAEGSQNGVPCIKVLLSRNRPAVRRRIPATVYGYPVVVEVTGPLRALGR